MSGNLYFDDFRIPPDSPLLKYLDIQPGRYFAKWDASSETLFLKKHSGRKKITLNITLEQLMSILMVVQSNKDKLSKEELKIRETIERKKTNLIIKDYQSHHVIPIDVCKKSQLVITAKKFGFDHDGPPNRLYLPITFHNGSHPKYSNFVEDILEEEWPDLERYNLHNNSEIVIDKTHEIIAHLKNELRKKSQEGICTINEMF
ncbi:AHH domain-containing protein [Laspinema olomoucense]|uniref:AHH domain-containing protein n=1 Tax=Laspinema olomoucense TaxID=3231600 RepID=UPI0021BB9E16|nr:AHH domain-containing protein [Laspinema sp. D3d]MCT7973080.1 AHH domain-containing protein [Laspinema sp. D3d]